MTTVQLGELAEINPRPPAISADEIVTFVGMAELDATTAQTKSGDTRKFSEVSKGYTVFADGDLLIAKITPCFENNKIGLAQLDHKIGVGSTEFHVLRPGDRLNNRYLLHFMRQKSIRRIGEMRMTGSAGQRRVPVAFLQDLPVPVPPLDEQRRIAGVLDRADSLRARQSQKLASLRALSRSVFVAMFGATGTDLTNGTFTTIGQVVKFKSGNFLPASQQLRGCVPVYGGNGINGFHAKSMFDSPQVVVGRVGAYCGAVHLTEGASWITDNALYVSAMPDGMEVFYLAEALREANLNGYASRSGQPLISAGRIAAVPFFVPSVPAQRSFAIRARHIDRLVSAESRVLTHFDELFASLQSRAFSGQL